MLNPGHQPSSNMGEFFPAFAHNSHATKARDALRDLMRFYFALQNEMARSSAGSDADSDLIGMMKGVNRKYLRVMKGFGSFNDDMQRHALVALADAIKDMMFYIYNKRAGNHAGQ